MATTLRNRFESNKAGLKPLDGSETCAAEDSGKPAAAVALGLNMDQVVALQAKAEKLYTAVADMMVLAEPYFHMASSYGQQAWMVIEPYHPQELATAAYGLTLVFFGGIFMTLVASCEAVHIFGWDKIKSSFNRLYKQWVLAAAAFEEDNQLDEDKDGIADVRELTPHQLAIRRMQVLTKAIEPEQVAVAIEALTTAYVAVMATLRVKFAKAITLGMAIGNVLTRVTGPYLTQALKVVVPDEYEKWIPIVVRYGFRYLGVSVSWFLMRITTGAFAAIRGSSIFITGVCGYLIKYNYMPENIFDEGNPLLVGAWAMLAFTEHFIFVAVGTSDL